VKQLNDAQGDPVDLSGYYFDNVEVVSNIMQPSTILNGIMADFKA